MKFEKTEVFNFDGALRGMRNPMESWKKSDSIYSNELDFNENRVYCRNLKIGKNDIKLAQRLIRAGKDHRKFMRQIVVSVDITAPLYWWKEFDTYGVGVVKNSTSTMHKLSSTPITMDCFEMGDFNNCTIPTMTINYMWNVTLDYLESLRKYYNETKDKKYWKELIRLLPESWLQKRTVTMNYENLISIAHSDRKNHKLIEWSVDFFNWMHTLPYAEDFIFINIPDVATYKKGLADIDKMIESMIGACGELADEKCFEIQKKIKELMEV